MKYLIIVIVISLVIAYYTIIMIELIALQIKKLIGYIIDLYKKHKIKRLKKTIR